MAEKNNKTEVLRFRCTPEQREIIENRVAELETTISKYLLMLIENDLKNR